MALDSFFLNAKGLKLLCTSILIKKIDYRHKDSNLKGNTPIIKGCKIKIRLFGELLDPQS